MVLMDEAEEEKEMRRSLILTREGDRDRGSGYGDGRMLSSYWQWYSKTTHTKGEIRRGSGVYRQWGVDKTVRVWGRVASSTMTSCLIMHASSGICMRAAVSHVPVL